VSIARIGILVSGGGRTALNIATACARGEIPARVVMVLAHREEMDGVRRCREAGLRVAVLPAADPLAAPLADRIDAVLEAAGVDLVCLAGYLRHFRVGTRWRGRTLNIHPSLLPDFGGHGMYGMHVHRAVIAAGRTTTGCTVHQVDEEYDRGPIVLQRSCAVLPDDRPETLAARVFDEECRAYPEAIRRFLTARARGEAAHAVPKAAEATA
jgi:phosphoribosylglycinamide formyltransferase-1